MTTQEGTDFAQKLFNQAFNKPRCARSTEYKAGALAALRFYIHCETKLPKEFTAPYEKGSAEADAWFSGAQEGVAIYRSYDAGRRS